MLKVTYKERVFIDKYKCIEFKRDFKAWSYFTSGISGELYYFRLNEFNYKTLGKNEIISIEEVE